MLRLSSKSYSERLRLQPWNRLYSIWVKPSTRRILLMWRFRIDVTPVIRRYAANGDITGERGRLALADLADFPMRRYPHDVLLPRIWDLRNNFTAYDGVYVALAEALDAILLTCDQRLAAAAGHHAVIALV